jgi:hypothetical protein
MHGVSASTRFSLIAAMVYAIVAFLFGRALGERGELGIVQYLFAGVIPLATVVLTIVAKRNRLLVFLTGAAMLAGVLLGQRQFARAWENCLTEGVALRAKIVAYHTVNERYPSRLEELEGDVPCRCGMRATILHYLSNDRGFRLWMTNDRETILFTASGRSSIRRSR